ncbi:MAG: hypothetical protein RSE06_13155, partial [Comamonas sp.]
SAGTKARLKGVDCEVCGLARHEDDSRYCRRCGSRLQLPGAVRMGATPTAAQPAGGPAQAPSRQDKSSATETETA